MDPVMATNTRHEAKMTNKTLLTPAQPHDKRVWLRYTSAP